MSKKAREEAQKALVLIGIIETHLKDLRSIKNESVQIAIDTITDDFETLKPMILKEFDIKE